MLLNKKINSKKVILPYQKLVLIYFVMIMCITVYNNSFLIGTFPVMTKVANRIHLLLRVCISAVAAVKTYNKGFKVKDCIILFTLFILSVLVFYTNRDFILFDSFFVAFIFSDVMEYKKIAKTAIISLSLCTLGLAILHYCGIMQESKVYRDGVVRLSLGFTHPNSLGRAIMLICLLYIVVRQDKFSVYDYSFLIAAAIFTKIAPDSNTSTILILFTIFLIALLTLIKKCNLNMESKAIRVILFSIVPLIIIGTYICIYSDTIIGLMKDFYGTLASRLILGRAGIDKYGLHLLGRRDVVISFDPGNYFTLDIFYVYLPVIYGLITSIFFLASYYYLYCKAILKNDYYLVIVFIVLSVYAISEQSLNTFYVTAFYIMANCSCNRCDNVEQIGIS